MRNAIVISHEIGTPLLPEVPEDLFRQAADTRREVPRKTVGNIVTRQQKLVNTCEEFRFVALDPRQFRGREVPRRVERMAQTEIASDRLQRLGSDPHGPRIAPDDRLTERLSRTIEADQSVHLVGDAD